MLVLPVSEKATIVSFTYDLAIVVIEELLEDVEKIKVVKPRARKSCIISNN